MHNLHIIGLTQASQLIVCEDTQTQERFTLANDARLKSAISGELPYMTQNTNPGESQLTPREIQHRIRSGQSVATVAELAGTSVERVERFAHPVLLERERVAHMALAAHPVRSDGPSEYKLAAIINHALISRGVSPELSRWDAWKSPDGNWVVQLAWQVGKSENLAHWQYTPGAHGGMITELDDSAKELSDPNYKRTLQSVSGAGRKVVLEASHSDAADEEYRKLCVADEAADRLELVQPEVESKAPRAKKTMGRGKTIPAWEDVLLGVRSAHQ